MTSKHLNVLVWSYCTGWQMDCTIRYCVWLQLCCQCRCCLLIIISVSCLLFMYTQHVWSTNINTVMTYHTNHQRTRQLSASFAYYTLLPHTSITLLSSGRYHFVCLFTYLLTHLALWDPEIHQWAHCILIIKPTICTNFSNLFWNKTLHVSDSSSVHHQEFSTVHTAMVYVIQLASRIRTFQPDPARKLSANLYNIYHCCVYSAKLLMMGRGTVQNM